MGFGNTCHFYKLTDGFRCKASSAQAADGNKAGIIPAVGNTFLNQFFDIPLSGYNIIQVHLCKFDLSRRIFEFTFSYNPVIKRSVIFKFQRTDGMCDMFNGIFDGMSKIIHGVNAPFIACIVMCDMCYTIDNGISHVDVGRCHIDLGAEYPFSVCTFTIFHALKKLQVLLYASVTVGTVFAGLFQRSAIFTNFIGRQITHISLSFFNQLQCTFIHRVKIVGCKKQSVFPVCSQPFDIFLD